MLSRRQLVIPAVAVTAAATAGLVGIGGLGWGGDPPAHPARPFHLGDSPETTLWRALAQTQVAGAGLAPLPVPEVRALLGQSVKLREFLVPLEAGARHRRFLLAANPLSCPACQIPGPGTVLPVTMVRAVAETGTALTLNGTLTLRPFSELFFSLDGAEVMA
ncbi:DUF3299 domain-containing protein [Azospirillaceae bacterium]